MSKAYVIAEVNVHDTESYESYKAGTPQSIVDYGGQFIVRGGNLELLKGETATPRLVVIEFPSRAQANAWYHCETYRSLKAIRQSAATSRLLLVDGTDESFAP